MNPNQPIPDTIATVRPVGSPRTRPATPRQVGTISATPSPSVPNPTIPATTDPDRGPVRRRTFAEHADERDRTEEKQGRVEESGPRAGPVRRRPGGVSRVFVRYRRRVGEHPAAQPAGAEEQDRAQHRDLGRQPDTTGDGERADAGTGERADRPASVQARHDRPSDRALDRDRLGVHRHPDETYFAAVDTPTLVATLTRLANPPR